MNSPIPRRVLEGKKMLVVGEPADDAPDEPIEQTFEGPRVGRPDARTAACREACPAGKIGLDGADDDRKTAAKRLGLTGEEQAQGPGEAENPDRSGRWQNRPLNEADTRIFSANEINNLLILLKQGIRGTVSEKQVDSIG